MPTPKDEPHFVDRHVGRRIRELRHRVQMSQEQLASSLGLTFQQVQKYEKGANRVSASKLFEVAKALGVEVSWFFRGLPSLSEAGGSEDAAFTAQARTAEGREIDMLLARIGARQRRLVVDLARAVATENSASDCPEHSADSK